ncbi:unnamed protein product [marine sediment metagenome]|uniref:Uncharacterized protein n=1 Tax=marine sediment metagenome TaxID=412755 RepID=X0WP28_9ZZZZ
MKITLYYDDVTQEFEKWELEVSSSFDGKPISITGNDMNDFSDTRVVEQRLLEKMLDKIKSNVFKDEKNLTRTEH